MPLLSQAVPIGCRADKLVQSEAAVSLSVLAVRAIIFQARRLNLSGAHHRRLRRLVDSFSKMYR